MLPAAKHIDSCFWLLGNSRVYRNHKALRVLSAVMVQRRHNSSFTSCGSDIRACVYRVFRTLVKIQNGYSLNVHKMKRAQKSVLNPKDKGMISFVYLASLIWILRFSIARWDPLKFSLQTWSFQWCRNQTFSCCSKNLSISLIPEIC